MKAGWINILETGTVTVTSETTGYEAYRLYDRLFGKLWVASSTATQTVLVDQGISPVEIDTLVIPSGHLLNGCTLAWQYSSDNFSADVHDAVTGWTQSGSGEIMKQMISPGTHRYWRLTISGASVAPEAAEVFMTLLNEFNAPLQGAKSVRKGELVRNEGIGGQPHFSVNGTSKLGLVYSGSTQNATEQGLYRAWFLHWGDYARPFYIVDHNSDTGFFEFVEQPEITETFRMDVSMHMRRVH